MLVYRGYSEVRQSLNHAVVTVGNFDGLHLGHQKIINFVVARAKEIGGTSVVYTFRPHPHLALNPNSKIQLINSYDEKLEQLERLGVDVVIEESFGREFSTIAPEVFFSEILLKQLSAKLIVVGYDFGFGKNRSGNLEMLRAFCQNRGVELIVEPPLQIAGEICSSTKIRECLLSGNVREAAQLLGRPFFYRGLVVRGKGRGHTIGFSTANVHTDSRLHVKVGVYATQAIIGKNIYSSVTNVGRQPTFNSGIVPVTVETHIFDFCRDIYGDILEVRMIERIRDEQKFDGVQSLVSQISKDVLAAKSILTS